VSPFPGPFAKLQAGRRAAQLYREGVKLYDQHDLLGSEQLLRESFEVARAAGDLGQTARSADPLSEVLWRKRRWADCAAVVEIKLDCHRRLEGLDGDLTFEWRDELIWLLGKIDRFTDAEALAWERMQAIRRRFPEPGAFHAFGLVTLAWTLRRQGRVDEAEPLCREALEIVEKSAGAHDPRCGWAHLGLAAIAEARGDFDSAADHVSRAWNNWNRVGRLDMSRRTRDKLMDLYLDGGRPEEARKIAEQTVLRGQRMTYGAFDDPEVHLKEAERLGRIFAATGRPEEARRLEMRAAYLRQTMERDEEARRRLIERVGDAGVEAVSHAGDEAQAEFGGPVFFKVGKRI
jgi:tetratricopeptide (TPR) repeat protein